jgi:hypothetical protein
MSDSGGGVNERVRELLAEHGTTYAPYVDDRMVEGARRAGLPDDRDALAALLEESGQPARLAATLVRMSRNRRGSGKAKAAGGEKK